MYRLGFNHEVEPNRPTLRHVGMSTNIKHDISQSVRLETVSRILAAWARVGQIHTSDGKSFSLRHSA
jgi:hypothetical protein